jgi:hypothetical protein
MQRLHRIHAGFILAAAVIRPLRAIVSCVVIVGGCIWATTLAFTERPATVLIVSVSLWGFVKVLRAIGHALGLPEPVVKSTTHLEKRRALRRMGLLKWR